MYSFILGFIVVLLILFLVITLLRNVKFDKWCNDMAKGKVKTETTSTDIIKDITKEETKLEQQSNQKIQEVEKLTKESKNINDFLDTRGVNKKDKEGS